MAELNHDSSCSSSTTNESSSSGHGTDSDSIVSANRSELSDASSSNYGGRIKHSDSLTALQVRGLLILLTAAEDAAKYEAVDTLDSDQFLSWLQ